MNTSAAAVLHFGNISLDDDMISLLSRLTALLAIVLLVQGQCNSQETISPANAKLFGKVLQSTDCEKNLTGFIEVRRSQYADAFKYLAAELKKTDSYDYQPAIQKFQTQLAAMFNNALGWTNERPKLIVLLDRELTKQEVADLTLFVSGTRSAASIAAFQRAYTLCTTAYGKDIAAADQEGLNMNEQFKRDLAAQHEKAVSGKE